MKLSVDWLKEYVTIKPPHEKVAENLTMAGLEVKKIEHISEFQDTVFEVEITSNRPDWLSHLGVAREIAAVENLSLKKFVVSTPVKRPPAIGWKLSLKETEACPYYTGVYLEGLNCCETPEWMRRRLLACGVRPVHLIVDITNYVMFEVGQPLHAFDADLIKGQEIVIRRARELEKFQTISDRVLELAKNDLVIADKDGAIALAGVMGGKLSEINPRTKNVFLESAFFTPKWVRQSAKRYEMASDSSYRFERRVDPGMVDLARERAVDLLVQLAKPRHVSGVLRAGSMPAVSRAKIRLSSLEIERKLGTPIKSHIVTSVLKRLGFDYSAEGSERWSVTVPSFRPDVSKPVDLIEEIARVYGYDKIPETLPALSPSLSGDNPFYRIASEARSFFSGAGFYETVNFSLISDKGLDLNRDLKNAVKIHNPQNADLVWMRPSLLPGLLGTLRTNHDHGRLVFPFFEIANCYSQKESGGQPKESLTAGVLLAGKWHEKNWRDSEREVLYADLKGVVLEWLERAGVGDVSFISGDHASFQTGRCEKVVVGGKTAGYLGEVGLSYTQSWGIDIPVFFAEIQLSSLRDSEVAARLYAEPIKFPASDRDLSIVVSEDVASRQVEEDIFSLGGAWVQRVLLFDLFRGGRVPKGYKNLAYRITYQSKDRTLVSSEVQELHDRVAKSISDKYHATFQS